MYLYNTTNMTIDELKKLSNNARNELYYTKRKRKNVRIDETKNTTKSTFII